MTMESSVEEQEVVIFHPYPCGYYVQSPSTVSHANSSNIQNDAESPPLRRPELSRSTLSLYSSSRGSNHCFQDQKKLLPFGGAHSGEVCRNLDGAGEGYYGKERSWWRRYLTYSNTDSNGWVCLQLGWRAAVSLTVALLFFYFATNPPSPNISLKTEEVREFTLGEGVDKTGVATKILTCNCTVDLTVDNGSKLFGLHILPPFLQLSFGRLPIAVTHGPRFYANRGTTTFRLSVGTAGKPMYGAGRTMADLIESGTGLDLTVRLKLVSHYRVVWNIIKPEFHHRVECSLVIGKGYDEKRHTQSFNSTCSFY